MDIYEILKEDIIINLTLIYKDVDFSNIKNLTLETPKNIQFGELSTNAAMILTKILNDSPKNIATKLKDRIKR